MDKRGSRGGHLNKEETMWSKSVARILCGGGEGGWGADIAKVDETTECIFIV